MKGFFNQIFKKVTLCYGGMNPPNIYIQNNKADYVLVDVPALLIEDSRKDPVRVRDRPSAVTLVPADSPESPASLTKLQVIVLKKIIKNNKKSN